jgi:hypothetical protein
MVDIRVYPSVDFPGQYILQIENEKGKDIKVMCPNIEKAFETIDNFPKPLIDSLK